MTRNEFLHAAFGIAVSAFGLTVLGCGSSTSPAPDPNPNPTPDPDRPDATPPQGVSCVDNGTRTAIAQNHGHVMVVTKEEVAAGVPVTYHIRGNASHDHVVVVSDADMATLKLNDAIMKTSTREEGHAHGIMVACI